MPLSQRACFFQVRNFSVAVEGQYTDRVLKLDQYTKLPRTRDDFLGLVYVQGRIVPLLDLYTMFQLNNTAHHINHNDTNSATENAATGKTPPSADTLSPASYTNAIIINTQEHEFALASSKILGFFMLTKDILPAGVAPALKRYVLGDVLYQDDTADGIKDIHVSIINVPTLVDAVSQRLEVV